MTLTSLPHRLTADDLRAAGPNLPGMTLSTTRFVGAVVVLAGFAGSLVGLVFGRHVDGGSLVGFAALSGCTGFAALAGLQLWFARKQDAAVAAAVPESLPEQVVAVDEDGIRLRSELGETFTRWAAIERAERRGDDRLLVGRNGIRHAVPARAMPDADWRAAFDRVVEAGLAGRGDLSGPA